MSFGRKPKAPPPAPLPPEPTRITRVENTTALGDRVITEENGNTQRTYTQLGAENQQLLNSSRSQVQRLSSELSQGEDVTAAQERDYANRLYERNANALNAASDRTFETIRSQNAQRFGGAYNSTFGTQLLGEVEGQRQANLSEALFESEQAARQVSAEREASRLRRLDAFSSLMSGTATSSQYASQGSASVLENGRDRALRRLEAIEAQNQRLQEASDRRNESRQQQRGQRNTAIGSVIGGGLGFLVGGPAGAALGATAGGAVGSQFK